MILTRSKVTLKGLNHASGDEWVESTKVSEEQALGPLRCLIVDDVATNQRILQHLMGRCGLEATVCGGGEHAIELCRDNFFHIVLMDLHMPEVSGFEAGEKIIEMRKNDPFPLLYAQTADETESAMERALAIGFDGYLKKPIRPHEVEQVVEKVLRLFATA